MSAQKLASVPPLPSSLFPFLPPNWHLQGRHQVPHSTMSCPAMELVLKGPWSGRVQIPELGKPLLTGEQRVGSDSPTEQRQSLIHSVLPQTFPECLLPRCWGQRGTPGARGCRVEADGHSRRGRSWQKPPQQPPYRSFSAVVTLLKY